eukprot:gene2691-8113_t
MLGTPCMSDVRRDLTSNHDIRTGKYNDDDVVSKADPTLHELRMLIFVEEHCPLVTPRVLKYREGNLLMENGGNDLVVFMKRFPVFSLMMAEREALFKPIIFQIVGHLATLHNLNIAHLDIKPENIVVCKTDKQKYLARLIDFEFASVDVPISTTRGTV